MQTDFKIGAGIIVKQWQKGITSSYIGAANRLIFDAGVISTIRPCEFGSDLLTPQRLRIGAGIIGTAAIPLKGYLIGACEYAPKTRDRSEPDGTRHPIPFLTDLPASP